MRLLLVGDCKNPTDHIFRLSDPDAPSESQFEVNVVRTLACAYPGYKCVMFRGAFRYDTRIYRPDLALVSNEYRHWFVVEVELLSHSLDRHVLPQARAFRYGVPEPGCVSDLAKSLDVSLGQAKTLVENVPRSVAVVANRFDIEWERALRGLEVQFVAMSVFEAQTGVAAVEVTGSLAVLKESLGFGCYSATDYSLKFHRHFPLEAGRVQIEDGSGSVGWWICAHAQDGVWLTKETGAPNIEHGAYVQLIRTIDGHLMFRRPA